MTILYALTPLGLIYGILAACLWKSMMEGARLREKNRTLDRALNGAAETISFWQRKRSGVTAKGNRTRASKRRVLRDQVTEQLEEAGRAA